MEISILDEAAMADFGKLLAAKLQSGAVIELIADVGAGKTVLTRAIARALGVVGPIQSPTFTISNRYDLADGRVIAHYDFYRLNDAGIMADELAESINDDRVITIIEWGDIVADILPRDRLTIKISADTESSRLLEIIGQGSYQKLVAELAR